MNNDLLNFASIFPWIWSTCSLVTAMKECFLFLLNSNFIFIAVLYLKLWFLALILIEITFYYFQVLSLVLSLITLLTVHLSYYWLSK